MAGALHLQSGPSHPGDGPKQVDELRGCKDLRPKLRCRRKLPRERNTKSSEEIPTALAPVQE